MAADERGRELCAALNKRGAACGATARPGGYCIEHTGGSDLLRLGFSRKQMQIIETVEDIKRALSAGGLTLAQIRASFAGGWSAVATDELQQQLRQDPDIEQSRERRPDALGREREQVVLRLRRTDD